jgi:DUF1365 family protein
MSGSHRVADSDLSVQCHSAVYVGKIRHRRFVPGLHSFTYPLFMLYLDLDELPELFAKKWFCSLGGVNFVSFKRQDYFSPNADSLKAAVIDKVQDSLGGKLEIASVRALLHVRYLNMVFNPVVFYYCFDAEGEAVAVLAEITNTPWGERHHYVLPMGDGLSNPGMTVEKKSKHKYKYHFDKAFHVSPFNPMNMVYDWVFSRPGKNLHVHMESRLKSLAASHSSACEKHFDATLVLERKEFNEQFAKILIQSPFITVKVITGIYWQAFKLWLKRMPFYDHPKLKD